VDPEKLHHFLMSQLSTTDSWVAGDDPIASIQASLSDSPSNDIPWFISGAHFSITDSGQIAYRIAQRGSYASHSYMEYRFNANMVNRVSGQGERENGSDWTYGGELRVFLDGEVASVRRVQFDEEYTKCKVASGKTSSVTIQVPLDSRHSLLKAAFLDLVRHHSKPTWRNGNGE